MNLPAIPKHSDDGLPSHTICKPRLTTHLQNGIHRRLHRSQNIRRQRHIRLKNPQSPSSPLRRIIKSQPTIRLQIAGIGQISIHHLTHQLMIAEDGVLTGDIDGMNKRLNKICLIFHNASIIIFI